MLPHPEGHHQEEAVCLQYGMLFVWFLPRGGSSVVTRFGGDATLIGDEGLNGMVLPMPVLAPQASARASVCHVSLKRAIPGEHPAFPAACATLASLTGTG